MNATKPPPINTIVSFEGELAEAHREDLPERLLSTAELSERWGCSRKKLAHDRMTGRGVAFVAIGRLCRYKLSQVLAYEHAHSRRSTSDTGGRRDG